MKICPNCNSFDFVEVRTNTDTYDYFKVSEEGFSVFRSHQDSRDTENTELSIKCIKCGTVLSRNQSFFDYYSSLRKIERNRECRYCYRPFRSFDIYQNRICDHCKGLSERSSGLDEHTISA